MGQFSFAASTTIRPLRLGARVRAASGVPPEQCPSQSQPFRHGGKAVAQLDRPPFLQGEQATGIEQSRKNHDCR